MFKSKEEARERFRKAFVGKVIIPGSSYNMQGCFEIEGIFSVKLTPMGANLCLLEDLVEGFLGNSMAEGEKWWKIWFMEVRRWKDEDAEVSRAMWVRAYDISCLGWCSEFFVSLANSFGSFICLDEYCEGL